MIRSVAMLALLAFALGACVGGGRPAAPSAPAPRSVTAAVPRVMAPGGLEGVIGMPAAALTRRFGQPRIDLVEGDARKLQFAGATCILDIYLYPVSAGAGPTATNVAARLRLGGAVVDPAACIHEIERQSNPR